MGAPSITASFSPSDFIMFSCTRIQHISGIKFNDRYRQVEKGQGDIYISQCICIAGGFTRIINPYFDLCWVLSQ